MTAPGAPGAHIFDGEPTNAQEKYELSLDQERTLTRMKYLNYHTRFCTRDYRRPTEMHGPQPNN